VNIWGIINIIESIFVCPFHRDLDSIDFSMAIEVGSVNG
jgi:hypothetical protein